MVAGAASAGSGAEGQALDMKRVSPRLTWGDGIVLVGAAVLVLLGWALKTRHDTRMVEAEVAGVTVAYPRGWFTLPAEEPEVLRAISDEDGRTTLRLSARETDATDVVGVLMMSPGAGSAAIGETAYTQLGNAPAEVDGGPVLRSDYAYVETRVGGVREPRVIGARQYAWIGGGRLYVLALEAPSEAWDEAEPILDRIVDRIETPGVTGPAPVATPA